MATKSSRLKGLQRWPYNMQVPRSHGEKRERKKFKIKDNKKKRKKKKKERKDFGTTCMDLKRGRRGKKIKGGG